MGWVFAILLAGTALAGLWLSRRSSRTAIELAVAALMIGLAGYAWQGSPDMPGSPVSSSSADAR